MEVAHEPGACCLESVGADNPEMEEGLHGVTEETSKTQKVRLILLGNTKMSSYRNLVLFALSR